MSSGEKVLQQPAHLIRLLAGGAIRVENGDFLYCFSPTGNNGVSRLCTRVLNDIAHIRGAACHLPLKGKAGAKLFPCRSIFPAAVFSEKNSSLQRYSKPSP